MEIRMTRWLGTAVLALGLSTAQCSTETRIVELEPPQGTYLGGEEILIHGHNLPVGRGGASVVFGRRPATNVVLENDGRIKVTSPAGDRNVEVDVTVMFDDGRSYLLKSGFRYLDGSDNSKVMKNFFKK
jgi:hypothetical protein